MAFGTRSAEALQGFDPGALAKADTTPLAWPPLERPRGGQRPGHAPARERSLPAHRPDRSGQW